MESDTTGSFRVRCDLCVAVLLSCQVSIYFALLKMNGRCSGSGIEIFISS